jgi:hypothetical protein
MIISCVGIYGDGYNIFAFESYPRPATDVLNYLGINLKIVNMEDWNEE